MLHTAHHHQFIPARPDGAHSLAHQQLQCNSFWQIEILYMMWKADVTSLKITSHIQIDDALLAAMSRRFRPIPDIKHSIKAFVVSKMINPDHIRGMPT
jgi:hypothetical protein